MSTVSVLLPALARFQSLHDFQRRLLRADVLERGATHELATSHYFHWAESPLPAAALMREHLAHDAGDHAWLCAELAHIKPDMTGARMLACGSLDVSRDDADALAAALQPLFDDRGMALQTTLPARWHVRLPDPLQVPALDPPGDVLGDDLIRHLPEGDAGKPWRQLLNEVQIVLHQHPINQARAGQGKPAINSLWLWGGGRLPAQVQSDVQVVHGDDLLLASLASAAGVTHYPLTDFRVDAKVEADTLLDLGRSGEPAACRDLLFELLDDKRTDTLALHFADGERYRLRRGQRWRLWRRGS
ncbi:MAG TPA: phosphoglycerate mutase [Oleiagrimonas sp.]|nr:phosphoglycerate mutase [Oleiagrimonas sp.]